MVGLLYDDVTDQIYLWIPAKIIITILLYIFLVLILRFVHLLLIHLFKTNLTTKLMKNNVISLTISDSGSRMLKFNTVAKIFIYENYNFFMK